MVMKWFMLVLYECFASDRRLIFIISLCRWNHV